MLAKYPLAAALSVAAVAAFYGCDTTKPFYAESVDADALGQKLLELRDAASAINARADAEGRELTGAEQAEIRRLHSEFEAVEARLAHAEMAERANASSGRKSRPPTLPADRADADAHRVNARAGLVIAMNRSPAAQMFGSRPTDWKEPEDFFRAVANRVADPRLISAATGVEGTGVDGGFSVPTQWFGGLLDQALQAAEFAPRCTLFPCMTNALVIPLPDVQDRSTNIAGISGNWANENSAQTAQALKWRSVESKLNKIFVLAEASNELAADGLNYTAQLTGAMSTATAYSLDSAILAGTGVGQPRGIIGHASAIEVTPESGQAADTILFDNLVHMWSRVAPACQKRAVWFVTPSAWPQLLRMVFPGTSVPVLLGGGQTNGAATAPPATIFGRPVVTTEVAPQLGDAGDIVLADMTQYALPVKGTARIEYDAGPGFSRDVATWRLILRVTGLPLWSAAITPRGGGPTLSWAAYLAARA